MITAIHNPAKLESRSIKWDVNNRPMIDKNGDPAFELMEDQVFTYRWGDQELLFIVKKGYIYDGASVPALATFLSKLILRYKLYPDGALRNPSPVHDRVYELKGYISDSDEFLHVYRDGFRINAYMTRKRSDDLFLHIMQRDNLIPVRVQKVVHWVLRNLGWTVWNEKKMSRKRRKK